MKTKAIIPVSLAILAALFLSACSTPPDREHPIQARDAETTDLADVTADALDLAAGAGPENVLMVFDLDNTLLAMEQGLGADQWYEWQRDMAKHDNCNPQYVGDRFAAQGALLFVSAMRPTQQNAASQVSTIQNEGIAVIIVTSRGQDYRLPTFRELRRNGFHFNRTAIGPAGGYDQPFKPVQGGRMSRYEDGVFMTAGQHKGQMLYALLQKTGTPLPAVIVMADDKQKNLDAVKQTFSELDVPVRAWRYSGEDANVANFDSQKSDTEWKSIAPALRQIQHVLGPDNYDLRSAMLAPKCGDGQH